VVPASKAGPKNWSNVVAACRDCNQRKANHTPQAANMPLLKKPEAPTWLPSAELDVKPGHVPRSWLQYLQLKKVSIIVW
jgi:5-methylcytosine-specific restriction endonuclease McrA